jgi:hypothetical protein
MKKHIWLSISMSGLIFSASVQAADNLSTMLSEGEVSGQIRAFHVDREYQGTSGNDTHRNATAIGGHLKFVTDEFNGFSAGVAVYGTNGLFLHSPRDNYSKNDMTLTGKDNKSYAILGEAFLEYKSGNTGFKGGRIKYDSPMMGTDDVRMLPNLFEGYFLTNKDIKDTTVSIGHVTRFAQGTFGRVYNGGLLSATSGYSAVDSRDNAGYFTDIGEYTVGKRTDGVTVASAIYTGVKDLKVQLFDYYAHDIVNTIYADVNYKMSMGDIKPFVAAQFIKQDDIGDSLMKDTALGGNGDIDSFYWAAKVGAKYNGFTAYIAHSQTTDNDATDASYTNAIVSSWGGMPAYTQGMVTRHQFLAGTDATKVAASYSFKEDGVNLSTAVYYTSFDMDANSGYGDSRTATEPGFDIQYYPEAVKNLQLRFRGNFPRKFAEDAAGKSTGWSEYRFIANYNF